MAKIGSEKVNNLRKIAKQLVGLTVALLLFFTASSTAFAFDSRYLETAYWQEADTTKFAVDIGGAQGDLIGSVEYFTLDESVYFRFDISEIKQNESTENDNTNGTSIFFEFSIKNNLLQAKAMLFRLKKTAFSICPTARLRVNILTLAQALKSTTQAMDFA